MCRSVFKYVSLFLHMCLRCRSIFIYRGSLFIQADLFPYMWVSFYVCRFFFVYVGFLSYKWMIDWLIDDTHGTYIHSYGRKWFSFHGRDQSINESINESIGLFSNTSVSFLTCACLFPYLCMSLHLLVRVSLLTCACLFTYLCVSLPLLVRPQYRSTIIYIGVFSYKWVSFHISGPLSIDIINQTISQQFSFHTRGCLYICGST